MRVEAEFTYWVIVRGRSKESFFVKFIWDVPRWTSKRPWTARRFPSKQEAEETMNQIRKASDRNG